MSTEIATTTPANPVSALALLERLGLKAVKQVTRTVLQQKEDVPFCVTFESKAFVSKIQQEGKRKMSDARVCDVLNFETQSHQILIMNTVLEGELERAYPTAEIDEKTGEIKKELPGYVGKTFLIRSHFPIDLSSATGKKSYKVYEIIEVTLTGDADAPIEPEGVVADGTDPVGRSGKSKS